MTCSNESAVQNPWIRAAGEVSFLPGNKAAAEKPCRLGGKNKQLVLSHFYRRKRRLLAVPLTVLSYPLGR